MRGVVQAGNAKLRYYMHIPDPDSLSDEEWAQRLGELHWIWEREAEALEKADRKPNA